MKFSNATLKYFIDNDMYYFLKKNINDILNAPGIDINWDFMSMIVSKANVIDLFKRKLNWKIVSGAATLDVATLEQFYAYLDKGMVSRHQTLSRQFIKDHGVDLNWDFVLEFQDVCDAADMTVVDMFVPQIDKNKLIEFNQVSMDYLNDNYADLDKEIVSRFQVVDNTFISANVGDLNFNSLMVGGSITDQADFISYQPMVDMNIGIEFVDFDIPFIELNYANLNKNRIWRYTKEYTDQFLIDHIEDIDFNLISKYANLTDDQLDTYIDELDLVLVSKYQTLSESFINDNILRLDAKLISKHQVITETLLLNHPSKFDLNNIAIYQTLSDAVLKSTIAYRLPFNVVAANQTLTEAQATYFKERLPLNKVLKKSGLPFSFVIINIDKFDMYDVCRYCSLTTTNIEALGSDVAWSAVSKYQILPEAYITARKDKLNIDLILNNQTLTTVYRDSLISWYLST